MQSEGSDTSKPEAGWVFHPGDGSSQQSAVSTTNEPPATQVKKSANPQVQWTAQEFVEHERGSSWYLLLGIGAVVSATAVMLLTHDKISAIMIVIVAFIFGSFACKKPRTLEYSIDDDGIMVGLKKYPYSIFKSFSVTEEGSLRSLMLMPLKRFMPLISIYYSREDEEKILQKVANYLPFEEYRQDVIDKFMHKIRF